MSRHPSTQLKNSANQLRLITLPKYGCANKNRKAEQTINRLAAKHSLKRIGTLGAMHHLAPFRRSCLGDRDDTHDR
ncbi:hypothetical protein [Anoxybacteroides rupiense]|uniref:hypothetical protein n=1 Tax=Anoxybacteroides rupiense TaxID=311460 RepID=UPI001F090241|nr:hypothetical protein [Anoxybacillus rupiensis]